MCKEFEEIMKSKFEMSAMGEMKFFLGLQVEQKKEGIFIHQTKYVYDILKKFGMDDSSPIGTLIQVNHLLEASNRLDQDVDPTLYRSMIGSLMYLTSSRPDIMGGEFNLYAYTDSDYGGCNFDRKSTSGGCQFLGDRLVSWQCKKQTSVAN
uniref:uncharacterized mitochondrial protein AtMg00810-like n=1 Tax=Erigeron canadensis TaxID=72917 RepID=UPI001CB91B54|nr:uncharacterized mitochondrial protein AtMg00810-like [Erigeron canadensis]